MDYKNFEAGLPGPRAQWIKKCLEEEFNIGTVFVK